MGSGELVLLKSDSKPVMVTFQEHWKTWPLLYVPHFYLSSVTRYRGFHLLEVTACRCIAPF